MAETETYVISVRVAREPTNEADGWRPGAVDVAEEIMDRMGQRDLDTGWHISAVWPNAPAEVLPLVSDVGLADT